MLMIRPATLTDYEAIASIRQSLALDTTKLEDSDYVEQVQQDGFLVALDINHEAFVANVANYIVGETDEGEINGFLRLDDEQEMAHDEVPQWFSPEMKDIYWTLPHANIGKIAVLPTAKRQGLGTQMLAGAEQLTRERQIPWLFAYVAYKPITNYASMRFHAKNGFQQIALERPQFAYNMQDYQGMLYGKKL
jgi:GNAT superfamily N-acetyltransferase